MKHHDSSHTSSLGNGWQVLGSLELSARASSAEEIQSWLAELLKPLRLSVDFQARIFVSAQDACSRLLGAGILQKLGHIHLIVRVPSDHSLRKGQNWGFFRIEKVDDPIQDAEAADHSVELYLYLEG